MLVLSSLAAAALLSLSFSSALATAAAPSSPSCIDCVCISNTSYQCNASDAHALSQALIAQGTATYGVGAEPVQIAAQGDCCLYAYLPDGGDPSYARDVGYGLSDTVIGKCAAGTGVLGGFGNADGNEAEKLTLQKCGTPVQYPPFADHKGPLPGQPDCCPS